MKLIIAEKQSVATIIAHSAGAREKVYGDNGKAYCYKGNGYYVVGARGHLYGLGNPDDYGYSKTYNMDELPMFPDFKIFPCGEDTADLRSLISQLINLPEVDELICATDAGREGELIFRQIYQANGCTKPVKRLWCNSMTDEAIRKQLDNLPPDSDYDGEYYAALARQKSDWIIGMNLSRLYGILDNYVHHIGRVKTPVLSMIVERDNEIAAFTKTVTYRLEMPSGALSDNVFSTKEEAEEQARALNGKEITVVSADSEIKTKNRPLLHSLTSLQQEANRIYGYTAKQTLNSAQSLYEKKLITYPRTDCTYISEDMRDNASRAVLKLTERGEYAERADSLITAGLNLDERVVNTAKMNGHDHSAIIPEANSESISGLSEQDRNIYSLVVNRFLCGVDKPYKYKETHYVFGYGDISFTLKTETVEEMGWFMYDLENKGSRIVSDLNYASGSTFTANGVTVKICETQPLKHFTDASLLSVMNNIDNRIDDKELKSAVSGKGIGTEATRADIIEELINAGYAERNGRNIVATDFGKKFISSIPDSVKSLERTAEWEQVFENIRSSGKDSDSFLQEVKDYVSTVIAFENSPDHHREPVTGDNPNAPKREIIGKCPRCGKGIYEDEKAFRCESGKNGCGFTLWKEDKYLKDKVTKAKAIKLLNGDTVKMKAENKKGEIYEADYALEDTGKYINLRRTVSERKPIGKCPRCGRNIFEGRKNFYCESGKDGCGFTLWKDDRYNGITITTSNAEDFLNGRTVFKMKKKLNGEAVKTAYKMIDTGKYVNIRAEEENDERRKERQDI